MCVIEDTVREKLKDLPEIPEQMMSFAVEGDFYGVVEWEVKKGSAMSFKLLDHSSCEIFHTKFAPKTEIDWHHHGEDSDEVIVCLEGELTLITQNGEQTVIPPNKHVLIPKQVIHMAISGKEPCQVIAIVIPKER